MRRLPPSSWEGRGGRGTVLSMLPPCDWHRLIGSQSSPSYSINRKC